MVGIDRNTGKVIDRTQHIIQSIEVLLTTPLGTRVMRRDVGFEILDESGKPRHGYDSDAIEAAAKKALSIYEPRIDVDSIQSVFSDGLLSAITVNYRDREDGKSGIVTVRY
ncbi:GPW/gp25 family protein [Rhodopseudomonas pseudopalustris]|uniref:IraD/Gp25-like domain-containing protein n=1 Tax=Rhodopseudomonas pseudopalustris TaxID=1513892 RepID=A0A1H8VXY1_9BRAD|nr:GPW/gp25 family protein [Rhodopseudomonas pseudopalustris]SEP20200.1 hypothetical protein SAMN05444123_11029 [Rhodopseudomonas pseudopalustris]